MAKLKVADFPVRMNTPLSSIPKTMIEENEWEGLPYRPDPNCQVCKGAGFVHPHDGNTAIFAQTVPCKASGCLRDSIRGNQSREVVTQAFETFLPIPGTEKALKAAKDLAWGTAKFVWLAIYGPTGNGKTHLGNAIIRAVKERGLAAKMILAADLFSMLKEGIKDNQTEVLLRKFKEIPFLVIDDYGVEYGSDWELSVFDQLMTSRYATAKPTVLITNKDLAQLPERIQDRFRDKLMSKAIHNSAVSFRARPR